MDLKTHRESPSSSSPDPDTSAPATPSSNNYFDGSDVYHTDFDSDSESEEVSEDQLHEEVGHLLEDSLTDDDVGSPMGH